MIKAIVCGLDKSQWAVENVKSNDLVLYGSKVDNVDAINLDHVSPMHLSCLKASFDDAWL